MIVGRFGSTSGAPYLEAWLLLPGLELSTRISLLVDTGADSTTLMPMNGQRIGLDYHSLKSEGEATGLGGTTRTFLEDAVLTFLDDRRKRLWSYRVVIDIVPPNPDLNGVPSLLGRDVIAHWRMVFDRPRDRLSFTVRAADAWLAI